MRDYKKAVRFLKKRGWDVEIFSPFPMMRQFKLFFGDCQPMTMQTSQVLKLAESYGWKPKGDADE